MTATTIPTHALDCPCDLCEDLPPVLRYGAKPESEACKAANVSPLARAALDNGVPFEDVAEYCRSRGARRP